MKLDERINEELKKAVRSGDKIRLETLRSIRAAIIEFNKSGVNREMNDQDELKILQTAAKRRRDAIFLYEKGGRFDLSEQEKTELSIIEEFLPKQMSEEEIRDFVKKVIVDTGAKDMKDMGKVMSVAIKELQGKASGALVQQVVKESLGNI
jgi:uncharacterized protein YqeY